MLTYQYFILYFILDLNNFNEYLKFITTLTANGYIIPIETILPNIKSKFIATKV